MVAKGWASDRRVARQVRTLQATADGTVLYSRPDPGNAAELHSLVGARLERLLAISGPGLLIVCDSAMGQPKTMREIDDAGVRFVVPLRASAGFRERFLTEVGHAACAGPVPARARSEAPAEAADGVQGRAAGLGDPGNGEHPPLKLRVAYIHSSEEATQVADARERALQKAEDALERMRNGLGGRYYKTREQVERRIGQIIGVNITGLIDVTVTTRKGKLTVAWKRNQDAIATAASFDGIYALATNLPGRLSAGQVLRLYKDQQIVERRHRDMKQTLKVRPIFLHNDDRVYALLSIVGIALLIFGLIEAQTRAALGPEQQLPGLLPEGRAASRPAGTSSPRSKASA